MGRVPPPPKARVDAIGRSTGAALIIFRAEMQNIHRPRSTQALGAEILPGHAGAQSIAKSIPLGLTKVAEPSTAGVFPHPDNRHAFVTVRNDDSMLVLDLSTGRTLARVQVQSSPDGVTYSPVQR